MVFWGVEVKPGKPYTHAPDNNSKGRLHLSQAVLANTHLGSLKDGATLKNGTVRSERDVVVQCNVGDKTPIYLCALSPGGLLRCCQLNLEFEEIKDVIFSVIGPGTVHLSGYYLCGGGGTRDDESESYGEDIAETETEKSLGSDEDEYENSFIDDSEPEFLSPSPVSSDGEDTMHVEKTTHLKGSHRRLKKMYQSSKSDDISQQQNFASHRAHIIVSESETDDKLPICALIKDKHFESDLRLDEDEKSREEINDARNTEVKDDANGVNTSNKKPDAYVGGECGRQAEQQHIVGSENGIKLKKKKKLGSGYSTQLKKKEKEQSKEGKPPETVIENDFFLGMGLKWANTPQIKMDASKVGLELPVNGEALKNLNDRGDDISQVPLHSHGVIGENGGKSKKKRKKKMTDEKSHEANTALPCDNKGKPQQDDAKAEGSGQDISFHHEETQKSASDGNIELPSSLICSENFARRKRRRIDLGEEKTLEDKSGSHLNGIEDDKAKQDEIKDNVLNHQMVQSVQSQKEASSMMLDTSAGPSDAEISLKKKKRRKNLLIGDNDTSVTNIEHKNMDKTPSNHRTLSNGLIIEDLEMGKPDGRVAITGKKISLRYTGKLKENGKVFDSNIDGEPLKFRLGKGKVLKGLDAGIDGMRVGDKRRLIIPPSMGYGSEGDRENVPPNSWLVYEVELVNAR